MRRLERSSVGLPIAAMAACALAGGGAPGCGGKPRATTKPTLVEPDKVKLAVLAVESDKFPTVAKAATDSLAKAHVSGVDQVEVSKVSLEVVQLSIECVEPTVACYDAVAKSLAANRLLFAQIGPAAKRKDVRVTITFFNAATGTPKTAEKVFSSERDATAGIDTLLTEATQP